MNRQRLSIGTFGEVGYLPAAHGRVAACAALRDWDGKTRLVQATASTAKAAERAMKTELVGRIHFQPSTSTLTADSSFSDLVEYWLVDLDLENRISKGTRQLYERNIRQLVLPVFADLTLREIGVARCDQFIERLGQRRYSMAKQARVVIRLALALAVRHEVIPPNRVDHVARRHRPPHMSNALTPTEVNAIRVAIAWWEAGRSLSGPKPDGQLGAIEEVMLGTSARIGEVLAPRRRDIDVASPEPSIRVAGTRLPATTGRDGEFCDSASR